MLKIQQKQDTKLAVNLLPCRIHYDGPIEVEKKYWRPEKREGARLSRYSGFAIVLNADHSLEGKNVAYFRGRELEGNAIKVPEGCKGSILRVTGAIVSGRRAATPQEEEDEEEIEQSIEETKAAEELGTFDEVMVWNHDVLWDATEDSYAKGIEEWVSFANAVSNFSAPESVR